MGADVEIKDLGEKEIMRMYRELGKVEINVGVLSSAGQDMVNIAFWNHYGTEKNGKTHIEERPFMAMVFDQKSELIKKKMAKSVSMIRNRNQIHSQLSKVGLLVQGLIQKSITLFDDPRNKDSTIRQKGFDNPLIGKPSEGGGRLRASISYEIRKASR